MRVLRFSACVLFAALVPAAEATQLSAADVKAARKIYEAKCAKCHKFYEPASYSQADWDDWMAKMSRKSKLKAEQDRVLRAYLDDYRKHGKFAGE